MLGDGEGPWLNASGRAMRRSWGRRVTGYRRRARILLRQPLVPAGACGHLGSASGWLLAVAYRAALAVGLLLFAVSAAQASGNRIFKWVDGDGDIHMTDTLAEVPEPYRSMYRAELEKQKEKDAKDGGTNGEAKRQRERAPKKTADSSNETRPSTKIRQKRERWKALVAKWRKRLKHATAELQNANVELARLRRNPLLRQTPKYRARIAAAEKRRQAALQKVEQAKKMLTEELPRRAKKADVPPKWLY